MGLQYADLDDRTREFMLSEVARDIDAKRLYISPRLNEAGQVAYLSLLREAIGTHSDDWLASQLTSRGLLESFEQRRNPRGGYTAARVPHNAAETLAEGEFNRFYARGLCLRSMADGLNQVEVYRAKEVLQPRPESEAFIGRLLDAKALLGDLRTSQGVEPAVGVPPGPNSGLSVRVPRRR